VLAFWGYCIELPEQLGDMAAVTASSLIEPLRWIDPSAIKYISAKLYKPAN
jgi:hypothetical protein